MKHNYSQPWKKGILTSVNIWFTNNEMVAKIFCHLQLLGFIQSAPSLLIFLNTQS
jgi:hypothetical protein